MESDRAQNFHDRLNQWVASQGFWFQLRYSMSGKGMRGSGLYHFLRLTVRVMMFLAIAAIGVLFYLIKRTDTDSYRDGLQQRLVSKMGAKEGNIEAFQRMQGKLSIGRFTATGSDGAFFTDIDLRDVSCKMGVFDGVAGIWNPGIVTVARMDVQLRAGAPSAEAAASLGDVLFREREGFEFQGFDAENGTMGWGYSDLNRGLIEGSQIKGRRKGSQWWFQFKGGTFSQNWLKGLEIVEMEVTCGADGLHFEKGLLKRGDGTLDLKGVTVKGKEKPVVSGKLKLKNLPFDGFIPDSAALLVEGSVSGELEISGSTNEREGISFQGGIVLADGDGLMIRDRLPLLKALRTVDVFNNYRRVKFSEGGFRIKTGGGNLEISNLEIQAEDLMTLKGHLSVLSPADRDKQSIADVAERQAALGQAGMIRSPGPVAKRDDGSANDAKAPNPVLERYKALLEERRISKQLAVSAADDLRYAGSFEVALRPDAFDQSPRLKADHPADEGSGRIVLTVPVEGKVDELTVREAEDLMFRAKR